MIEMGMGKYDRVKLVEGPSLWKAVVILDLASALKKPAVYEDIGPVGLHPIRRPGDLTTAGAMNGNLHRVAPFVENAPNNP
jgi:hypothetical protein